MWKTCLVIQTWMIVFSSVSSTIFKINLKINYLFVDIISVLSNAKEMEFATEARVSLINPPQGCSFCLTDTLLENYFHEPRFLRTNDVFKINIREYAYECTYSIINQFPSSLYFKVNILKINNKMNYHGCYIILETTNLIQETNMHCYFPRECFGVSIKDAHNCPPPLEKSLQHLEYCIRPFIENSEYTHKYKR